MKATHGDPDLFIAELNRDAEADLVERRILRLCLEVTTIGGAAKRFAVVATYLAAGRVIELLRYVGEWWGPEFEMSHETERKRGELEERLRKVAEDLELEVRGGRWTD